jgi:hypothetical protein
MIKGLRPRETFEDATRAYQHQHLVTFPNRVAVQALASVEMSRVVQQDLEQISRNAHLEHERQGQLLALGRVGVPHHIAEALPTENEPKKGWGIGQAMKVLAGGFRKVVGGGASDDSTSVGDSGGARSSGYTESVAASVDPPQPTPMLPPEDVMEMVIERVLQKDREKRDEEAANRMEVDEIEPSLQPQANQIVQVFQNMFDNRQDHRHVTLSLHQVDVMINQYHSYIVQQINRGMDIRVVLNNIMQHQGHPPGGGGGPGGGGPGGGGPGGGGPGGGGPRGRFALPDRSDVQTLAIGYDMTPEIGPPLPVGSPLVPRGARPRRMGGGHAIMDTAAASDEGGGSLDAYMAPASKAQAKPKSAPKKGKGGKGQGTRTSNEGATLVIKPKMVKTMTRAKPKGSQDKPDDE